MLVPHLFGWDVQKLPSPLPPLPASAGGTNPRTPPIAYGVVAALIVISIGVVVVMLWPVMIAAKRC